MVLNPPDRADFTIAETAAGVVRDVLVTHRARTSWVAGAAGRASAGSPEMSARTTAPTTVRAQARVPRAGMVGSAGIEPHNIARAAGLRGLKNVYVCDECL
jgi:hypothetical protein